MTAIVASMMDSCGDYIAYARTMGYPMPPKHAVNRGIAVEGMATILCGINYNHFRRRSCNKLFPPTQFPVSNRKQIRKFTLRNDKA